MSPVTGSQTRWQGRRSPTRRCAADWMETVRGAVPRVSQTARGAPPLRGPPSVSARMRRAPGIHACATASPPRFRGLDHADPTTSLNLLTPAAAISPEGIGESFAGHAEIQRNRQWRLRAATVTPKHAQYQWAVTLR